MSGLRPSPPRVRAARRALVGAAWTLAWMLAWGAALTMFARRAHGEASPVVVPGCTWRVAGPATGGCAEVTPPRATREGRR